eukprot:410364_1
MSCRQKLSKEFRNNLDRLKNSDEYKRSINKYGLSDYNVCILNKSHRKESINILHEQFSSGGNILQLTFNAGPPRDYMSGFVDHAIKTGISLVVLDKKNKVCFVYILSDALIDSYHETTNDDNMKPQRRALFDAMNKLHSKDKWYQKYIQNNNNKQFGQILAGELGATRSDVVGHNILKIILPFISALPVGLKSVKYYYMTAVHPATIHTADIITNHFFNNILKR